MTKQIRHESIQEPLDDKERELMNPDNWDWDNLIEGNTVGEPGASLTIPLTFEELDAIVEAAHAQGLSTEEFIKRLVLSSLRAGRALPARRAPVCNLAHCVCPQRLHHRHRRRRPRSHRLLRIHGHPCNG
jgi:hypothetical protein